MAAHAMHATITRSIGAVHDDLRSFMLQVAEDYREDSIVSDDSVNGSIDDAEVDREPRGDGRQVVGEHSREGGAESPVLQLPGAYDV